MKPLRFLSAFVFAAAQIVAADRASAASYVIVDTLGAATPTTTFSIFGSTANLAANDYLSGPRFSLSDATLITEIGVFLNNCETILSGVPQCPDTHPVSVQIRPELNGEPHPTAVIASFDLSHDNDPLTISYESVATSLSLPAGTYFALFTTHNGEAAMLLSASYGATTYVAESVTIGTLNLSTGQVFIQVVPMAVRILGESTPPMTITTSTTLSTDHSGSIVVAADGITLDCAGHTVTGPGLVGIDLSGRRGVTVKNCIVTGFTHGFLAANASGNSLAGNTARANDVMGFVLDNASGNLLAANRAEGQGGNGFEVVRSTGNTLRQNTTTGNGAHGVSLREGSANNLIEQNLSSADAATGFQIHEVRANTYRGNRAESNAQQGFVLSNSSGNRLESNTSSANGGWNGYEVGASDDTVLVGNKALGNASGHGFAIYESSRVLMNGNTAVDNGASGIMLNTVQRSELEDNEVRRNAANGIELLRTTTSKAVGNRVSENGNYGFVLDSSSTLELTGNDVRSHPSDGFAIFSSHNNAIVDNQSTGNLWGIGLYGSNFHLIAGNQITHSIDHGILLLDGSTGNHVERNHVTQSGLVGFLILDSGGNTLAGNIANQNGDEGFVLTSGSTGNTFSDNNAMTNRVGFSLQEGATGNTLTQNVAHANADIDAEDSNGPGANTWIRNNFGTTSGIN